MRRLCVLLTCLFTALGVMSQVGSASAAPVKPGATAATANPNPAGMYRPITATRLFDTRSSGALQPGVVRAVAIGGQGAVPASAAAVRVNVSVLTPARAGSVSIFPGTAAFNGSTTISFGAGVTEQRMITGNLGTDGSLAIRDNVAATNLQVVFDVVGYYLGGTATDSGAYRPITQVRVADTRSSGAIPAGSASTFVAAGRGDLPANPSPAAVVVNISVLTPSKAGTVNVYLGAAPGESQSALTFPAGVTTQSMVTVGLNHNTGAFTIANATSAPITVVADVVGYILPGANPTAAGSYLPAYDSSTVRPNGEIGPGATNSIAVLPHGVTEGDQHLPVNGVWAVQLNLTVNLPSAAGSLSAFAGDENFNGATTGTYLANHTATFQLTVRLSADGLIRVRNNGSRSIYVTFATVGSINVGPNPLSTYTSTSAFADQHGQYVADSCVGPTFCAGVERYGQAATYNGRSWSSPVQIPGQTSLTDVDCPAVNLCFAVGNQLATYDGSGWTVAVPNTTSTSTPHISCASTAFCIATLGRAYLIWDGATWTTGSGIATGSTGAVNALSCPSTTFCLGLDSFQSYVIFDGTSWSAPVRLPAVAAAFVVSVSCTSAAFCAAVAQNGTVSTYNGTSWSTFAVLAGRSNFFMQVDCTSPTFCLAVANGGYSTYFDGTGWRPAAMMGANTLAWSALDVSCVSETRCVAIVDVPAAADYQAYSLISGGYYWSAPSPVGPLSGGISGLACASTTFCLAVTKGGRAASFDGTTWAGSVAVSPKGLGAVGCVSSSFCVAISGQGVASYDGSAWSAVSELDPDSQLTTLACSTGGTCVAGDAIGQAFTYQAGRWSSPVPVSTSSIAAVSCAVDGSCLAMDVHGAAAAYTSGSWRLIDDSPLTGVNGLSCVSAGYCQATQLGGQSAAWNGTSWSAVPGGFGDVVCLAAAQCQSVRPAALVFWDGRYLSESQGGNLVTGGINRLACPSATLCLASDGGKTVDLLTP